jgi:hypothetical protein
MTETKTIAETNRYIVLDRYDKDWKLMESYQSEDSLERELIDDLVNLGYIFEHELNTPAKLLANAEQRPVHRIRVEALRRNLPRPPKRPHRGKDPQDSR